MALCLEDYGAVKVDSINRGEYMFYIPLDGPRDVLLADLATEINVYRDVASYKGEQYYIDGVTKRMNPSNATWMAEIEGRKL